MITELPHEPSEAARLAYVLFGAGSLLLLLEVFFANRIFMIFGGLSILGSAFVAFSRVSLELGALILLGGSTLISLGFLVVIAYFPNAPLARTFLSRTRGIPPEDTPGDDQT